MELKELKHNIEHNTLDTNLVIMKYSGNGDFITKKFKKSLRNNYFLSFFNLTNLYIKLNFLTNV